MDEGVTREGTEFRLPFRVPGSVTRRPSLRLPLLSPPLLKSSLMQFSPPFASVSFLTRRWCGVHVLPVNSLASPVRHMIRDERRRSSTGSTYLYLMEAQQERHKNATQTRTARSQFWSKCTHFRFGHRVQPFSTCILLPHPLTPFQNQTLFLTLVSYVTLKDSRRLSIRVSAGCERRS